MCEIYHSVRALSRTLCEKYHTFLALKKQRRRSAYGRWSRGVFSACSPFSLTVTRSCTGRRVQEAAPYRRHGPRTGGHMGQYKSLSGECRRGRTPAGPSRSFCHSGASLIRLASLGTFPLEGRRLSGDRKSRPYGGNQTGSVGSAEPGAEVEPHRPQFSTYPGPSGPAGI